MGKPGGQEAPAPAFLYLWPQRPMSGDAGRPALRPGLRGCPVMPDHPVHCWGSVSSSRAGKGYLVTQRLLGNSQELLPGEKIKCLLAGTWPAAHLEPAGFQANPVRTGPSFPRPEGGAISAETLKILLFCCLMPHSSRCSSAFYLLWTRGAIHAPPPVHACPLGASQGVQWSC